MGANFCWLFMAFQSCQNDRRRQVQMWEGLEHEGWNPRDSFWPASGPYRLSKRHARDTDWTKKEKEGSTLMQLEDAFSFMEHSGIQKFTIFCNKSLQIITYIFKRFKSSMPQALCSGSMFA